MHILIIEDEVEIAEGIRAVLESEAYRTTAVYDGQNGFYELMSGIYDLALVDIMLPKRSGLDLLSEARQNGITTPVILLTALSHISDKVSGLDCGADDYLTKPFDADELLARIRARLRRKSNNLSRNTAFADIHLEQATQKLYGKYKSVKLAPKEYQLLECLIINHGQIIPREILIAKIWGYDDESKYNQLDVYISFVRKKLRFVESRASIVAAKGVGFSLEDSE